MGRDIVVVGASSGGVEALKAMVGSLPERLESTLFVVLHSAPTSPMFLPRILNFVDGNRAAYAEDGLEIVPRRIFVAPPDRHLLLQAGRIRLSEAPKQNHFRPAIDPLFRSAAVAYGSRVVGVVLSGVLDDGASGLLAVKRSGGAAVVQDPRDAMFPDMPQAALRAVDADHVLPAGRIGAALLRFARERVSPGARAPRDVRAEVEAMMDITRAKAAPPLGMPTLLTCPDCGGVLSLLPEAKVPRFRCRVGHVFSEESLLHGQSESTEAALWAAVRMLEERENLYSTLAEGDRDAAPAYRELAEDARKHAEVVREILETRTDRSPSARDAGNAGPGPGASPKGERSPSEDPTLTSPRSISRRPGEGRPPLESRPGPLRPLRR